MNLRNKGRVTCGKTKTTFGYREYWTVDQLVSEKCCQFPTHRLYGDVLCCDHFFLIMKYVHSPTKSSRHIDTINNIKDRQRTEI